LRRTSQVIVLREVAGADGSGFTSKMSPLHLIVFANGNPFPVSCFLFPAADL